MDIQELERLTQERDDAIHAKGEALARLEMCRIDLQRERVAVERLQSELETAKAVENMLSMEITALQGEVERLKAALLLLAGCSRD